MDINKKNKKEAKIRLFKSIAKSTTSEQLDSCKKMLDLYEEQFGKNKIIRFYLEERIAEVPQEV